MVHENISQVCNELKSSRGEQLLRLLAQIYKGTHDKGILEKEAGASAIENAVGLGLVRPGRDSHIVLTASGYLVANVAKEYLLEWVDTGRQITSWCPPDEFIRDKDVLDLGCSFGRWLWHFQSTAKSVIGLEMQEEYIELGRALAERENIPFPEIRKGSVEQVSSHIPTNSKDCVFIRLVLNHVDISKTLGQIASVLRNGGIVWVQVEPWLAPFKGLLRKEEGRSLRQKGFKAFSILNSLVFMFMHRQLSVRIHGRMHSVHRPAYPPLWAWRMALSRAGFQEFHVVESRPRCIFWSRKL